RRRRGAARRSGVAAGTRFRIAFLRPGRPRSAGSRAHRHGKARLRTALRRRRAALDHHPLARAREPQRREGVPRQREAKAGPRPEPIASERKTDRVAPGDQSMAQARSRERSLLRKALSPSHACATPIELGGLADGSLAQPAATRLTDHISGCARYQSELTLLKEFENAAPGPDEEGAVSWISARLERRFSEAGAGPSPSRTHRGRSEERRVGKECRARGSLWRVK